jgi:hypothetical protein
MPLQRNNTIARLYGPSQQERLLPEGREGSD